MHFICLHERCKLIDVIFRFQKDIFGAVFPFLQKIGRTDILVSVLLNQNGNHFLVTLKRSIKWYEYYADALEPFLRSQMNPSSNVSIFFLSWTDCLNDKVRTELRGCSSNHPP